jgi:penicillin-binding protein 1A
MRHIRFTLFFLTLFLGLGGLGAYVGYIHYSKDLPAFDHLASYQPPIVTRVQAGDGRLLAEFATERRIFVPIKSIPPLVRAAVLAAEDRDFYQHGGINVPSIMRAAAMDVVRVLAHKRPVGASTITQQVAKNMLLGNERSLGRKIREAILATEIEGALSKDRILELYLNEIDFGRRAFGVAAASLAYFNKSLDELDPAECAMLAALLKGPGEYDPNKHPAEAKERRDYVLDGMAKIGAIDAATARAAMDEPIVLRKRDETQIYSAPFFTEEVRRELIQGFGEDTVYKSGLSVRTSLDPVLQGYATKALHAGLVAYDRRHGWRGAVAHVELNPNDAGWIKSLAAAKVPEGIAPWKVALVREVKPDGATIGLIDGSAGFVAMADLAWARPTLEDQKVGNPPRTANDVLKRGDVILVEALPPVAGKPPGYGLRQMPNVSGALVALDPHTGRVLAMEGGWSFDTGNQFNRATQAKRQMGSSIKPFAYLAALENGMTPSTLILNAPVAVDQGPNLPKWEPKNFEANEYPGPHTLRFAIEHSINTMTVRMAAVIGIDKIAPYIERLGIMDKMPLFYSMVLGAGETTPLRLTTAYAMLVNGGKRITPSLIDRVQDRDGRTIARADRRACRICRNPNAAPPGQVPDLPDEREQVLDPGTAYQMVNILQGVVQRGTGGMIGARLHYPLAGKTGTTNDADDTWFVGFSPDLCVGVFVGFDQPRTLGPREQGASVAAPIFADFMEAALKDKVLTGFRIPPGIRLARVNADTGQFAEPGDRNVIWEAFKPGTEPSDEVIDGGAGIETLEGGADVQGAGIPGADISSAGDPVPALHMVTPAPNTPASTGTGGLY